MKEGKEKEKKLALTPIPLFSTIKTVAFNNTISLLCYSIQWLILSSQLTYHHNLIQRIPLLQNIS